MGSVRTVSLGVAILAGLGVLVAAGPARADWHGDHGWHGHWHYGHWHRGWGAPAVVVAPRPYYYAPPPPPVVYAPPPVYYAPPPPVYYSPGVSFGVTFH